MSVEQKAFIDTNILIYAHDIDAENRRETARRLLQKLWDEERGVISVQVFQEFFVTVTRKILSPLSPAAARAIIRNYLVWPVENNDGQSVLDASEIAERYQLSFWDGLIIVAARNSGAAILYSEDLNHGQIVEGVRICNPFIEDEEVERGDNMALQRANILLRRLVAKANGGNPEIISYKKAYEEIFDVFLESWSRRNTPEVIEIARKTDSIEVAGLGKVYLDSFIVSEKKKQPGTGHWKDVKYSREDWLDVFGDAALLIP